MSDLISRQAAIERLEEHRRIFCKSHMEFTILSDKDKARVDEIDNCIATLINLPSAQSERKKGRWILYENQRQEDVYNDNCLYICSECGKSDLHAKTQKVPFCWNCGARMKGEQDEI